jgi:endoglucanase
MTPASFAAGTALAAAWSGCATSSAAAALPAAAGAPAPDLLSAPGRPLDEACLFDGFFRAYAARFLTADGQVVDPAGGGRTTSEGQSYALVHALVAGDRALFGRVLSWTAKNLGAPLPAWLWTGGKVRDRNSASDADLWMAWALLEAGRSWGDADLERRGRALASAIAAREVADLPGLGKALLPGAAGFRLDGGARLNPSYLVIPQLRRLALADPDGPWQEVLATSARILRESAPRGVAPDWIAWRGAFVADPIKGRTSSYDAIRVPLWAGMIPDADPLRASLQEAASGFLRLLPARLPEKIDSVTGAASDRDAPAGSLAALLPLALATGDGAAAATVRARISAEFTGGLLGDPPAYYGQNLALFAIAFDEGRLRFDAQGRLEPGGTGPCAR